MQTAYKSLTPLEAIFRVATAFAEQVPDIENTLDERDKREFERKTTIKSFPQGSIFYLFKTTLPNKAATIEEAVNSAMERAYPGSGYEEHIRILCIKDALKEYREIALTGMRSEGEKNRFYRITDDLFVILPQETTLIIKPDMFAKSKTPIGMAPVPYSMSYENGERYQTIANFSEENTTRILVPLFIDFVKKHKG